MNKELIEAYQAKDTEDLLNHIAWNDVILPKLRKAQEQYSKVLVAMTLGAVIPGTALTREQIAGRISGIDFVTELMKNILRRGDKAEEYLKSQGISV